MERGTDALLICKKLGRYAALEMAQRCIIGLLLRVGRQAIVRISRALMNWNLEYFRDVSMPEG